MNQTLHIFRKDTRRFWPEVLISTASVFACCWILALRFGSSDADNMAQYNTMRSATIFLVLLVPASWWLLIARVVHAEALVGDRQFWLTRPYEWLKLLAAKLLFVAVWIYGPLVAAQALLIAVGGFNPMIHPAGWFWLLMLDSGMAILPLFAMATVAPNFGRMTLALLGVGLLGVVYTLVSSLWTGYESTVPYPHLVLMPAILVAMSGIAIVLQYATRRLWPSAALLAVGLVMAYACVPAMFGMKQAAVSRDFADPNSGGVQLSFEPDAKHPVEYLPSERGGKVYVMVPLQISGVPEGAAIEMEDVKFSIEAPDGFRWTAPWWSTEARRYLSGTRRTRVELMISRELYDRYRNTPLTLHITVGLTHLRAGRSRTVTVENKPFAVPDFGVCDIHSIMRFNGLACWAALGDPPLNYVSAAMSTMPCSGPQSEGAAGQRLMGWLGSATQDPVRFGPISVAFVVPRLGIQNPDGSEAPRRGDLDLCPGTPVTFTQYDVERRTQASLTIPDFHLPEEPHR